MVAIEACGLTRDFKDFRAVDHLDFTVEPGEVFGFLGPNGAGKTTTIKMLTGQLRPTSGNAWVFGYDVVVERDQIKPRIGVVFEQHNLYERISGRDNLNFYAHLYGVPQSRVHQVIQIAGLANHDRYRVKNYSSGMKQALMIARALLHQPEIVFIDEPTKGLDPNAARMIRSLVSSISNKGVTIILTTHDITDVDQLCSQVAILDQGRIVALDSLTQLKAVLCQEGDSFEDVFVALTGHGYPLIWGP